MTVPQPEEVHMPISPLPLTWEMTKQSGMILLILTQPNQRIVAIFDSESFHNFLNDGRAALGTLILPPPGADVG